MPVIQLYRPDEEYLSSHKAIRRIAPAFRHVVLDRAHGEAEYRKEWDKYKSLNAPEVILRTYSLANCRTVWVEVTDDDGTNDWVRFPLWSRRDIFIKFESDTEYNRLRPAVEKLATLLGYVADHCSAETDEQEVGNPPGDVVFRFSFSFLPYANPPGLMEHFEKALREYLESRGFDFGMAGVGKTYTAVLCGAKNVPLPTWTDKLSHSGRWHKGSSVPHCSGNWKRKSIFLICSMTREDGASWLTT